MSGIINTRRTNVAICNALGLDAEKVHGLTIKIQGGEAPVVLVKYYLTTKPGDLLSEELKSYDLVPKDQA
jgi:hypothetical protein